MKSGMIGGTLLATAAAMLAMDSPMTFPRADVLRSTSSKAETESRSSRQGKGKSSCKH